MNAAIVNTDVFCFLNVTVLFCKFTIAAFMVWCSYLILTQKLNSILNYHNRNFRAQPVFYKTSQTCFGDSLEPQHVLFYLLGKFQLR